MKAVVKTAHGVGNIEVLDMPEPVCGEDEVKIDIKFTGICGTDLHLYEDTFFNQPPVIMGHEMCGVVCEIGSRVTKFKVGDRVTAENICISCGDCEMCDTGHYAICPSRMAQGSGLDGGFCRYVVCKEKYVFKIPDNCSFEEGALIEVLCCCVHGVVESTVIHAGDIVLVSGPGTIGMLSAQLAKAEGAYVIMTGTDQDIDRLAIAKSLGVDRPINISKENLEEIVRDITKGRGVDVVLECSGSEAAVNSGIQLIKKRGQFSTLSLFSRTINFDINAMIWKELRFQPSVSHTKYAWHKAIQLVEQGKVVLKPLITGKYPICEWDKAFEDFRNKIGLKILVYPED